MSESVYLDHAATTPMRPEVRAAMEPFFGESFANPSSVYRPAQAVRAALDSARDGIANCLGARSSEVVFTGGGTESDNAAIKGVALARRAAGRHLVTTSIEHHAVLHPLDELREFFGYEVTVVPVSRNGLVDPDEIERALRPDTTLVSVMWANNEIGTIQPVAEIGARLRARGITFHVDAVQAAASLPIDLSSTPIDLLSLSAHKFHGPKGVGVLYLRQGTPWHPLLTGGGQERNRRSGTENVAGIAGMAVALRLASEERATVSEHLRSLRDFLLEEILRRIPDTVLHGDRERRLPNNLNVSFRGVHGESLLVGLDLAGICASSGSACASGSLEPSHVLQAIGLSHDLARASLRLTVGRENTRPQMEHVIDVLTGLVARLRNVAPVGAG